MRLIQRIFLSDFRFRNVVCRLTLRSFCLDTKKNQKNQEPNMLPIAQCRATPAFGSGHPASTELSFAGQYRIKSAAQHIDLLYKRKY